MPRVRNIFTGQWVETPRPRQTDHYDVYRGLPRDNARMLVPLMRYARRRVPEERAITDSVRRAVVCMNLHHAVSRDIEPIFGITVGQLCTWEAQFEKWELGTNWELNVAMWEQLLMPWRTRPVNLTDPEERSMCGATHLLVSTQRFHIAPQLVEQHHGVLPNWLIDYDVASMAAVMSLDGQDGVLTAPFLADALQIQRRRLALARSRQHASELGLQGTA